MFVYANLTLFFIMWDKGRCFCIDVLCNDDVIFKSYVLAQIQFLNAYAGKITTAQNALVHFFNRLFHNNNCINRVIDFK